MEDLGKFSVELDQWYSFKRSCWRRPARLGIPLGSRIWLASHFFGILDNIHVTIEILWDKAQNFQHHEHRFDGSDYSTLQINDIAGFKLQEPNLKKPNIHNPLF